MTYFFICIAIYCIAMLATSSFITNGYGFYTITKGKHFSTPYRMLFNLGKKTLKFRVYFDNSCRQVSETSRHNRLFGSTTNFSLRTNNSIQLVWRYLTEDDRVQIGYSYFDKGVQTVEYFLFELSLEAFYELEIRKIKNNIEFYIDDIAIDSIPSTHKMFGYKLWPMLDKPSTNDIEISLQKPNK